mmetsp:Transcript_977/g.3761  ORF Transcript_977/g.3761 Transcript_977/m.3761 type:complete len:319 (+) Transcript_977:820-1776(+)
MRKGDPADEVVRLLVQLKGRLVPELLRDLVLAILEAAHGVDEVEVEELLEPHQGAVVLREHLVPPPHGLFVDVRGSDLVARLEPCVFEPFLVRLRLGPPRQLAADALLLVHVQHHYLPHGPGEAFGEDGVRGVGPVQVHDLVVEQLQAVHLFLGAREPVHENARAVASLLVGGVEEGVHEEVHHLGVGNHAPRIYCRLDLRVVPEQRAALNGPEREAPRAQDEVCVGALARPRRPVEPHYLPWDAYVVLAPHRCHQPPPALLEDLTRLGVDIHVQRIDPGDRGDRLAPPHDVCVRRFAGHPPIRSIRLCRPPLQRSRP